jgi:hypothetical protein
MENYRNSRACGRMNSKSACASNSNAVDNSKETVTKADMMCDYDFTGNYSLAMAYVPWQQWNKVLDAESAMAHGTIFPELVKPFQCYYCDRRGGCL